jgi:hypothetical protein
MGALGPGWEGVELPLDERVAKRAGVFSYVQRRYSRDGWSLWFYVGYVTGWAPSAIHYPEICFPGTGLSREGGSTIEIACRPLDRPARFRELVWQAPEGGRRYTLWTFYVNGRFEPSPLRLRAERLFGVRYFAVITLSGTYGGALDETRRVYSEAIQSVVPRLLEHFPATE